MYSTCVNVGTLKKNNYNNLVVLAMPVHHPVLSIGADLQFEGGDIVGLLSLFRYGSLCGNPCQNLEEMKVNLKKKTQRLKGLYVELYFS